jgi:hypothetical protein
MKKIYFYSEKKVNQTINEMFTGFKTQPTSAEEIKKNNFMNQNILLIVSREFLKNISRSFFFNNRVVIFCETSQEFNNKIFFDAKVFNRHININKFINETMAFFRENSFNYGDIKIVG